MEDDFPKFKRPTLILVMGLPLTWCEVMSSHIAKWAKCGWLRHEVMLDSLSEEAGYGVHNLPSEEEGARLKRLSFDIICSSARFLLAYSSPIECVIISSSILCYESQLLALLNIMQLDYSVRPCVGPQPRPGCRLLIIECMRKNKFKWQRRADNQEFNSALFEDGGLKWYWPKSWKDVEKAILDRQQGGLDDYLLTLLQQQRPTPTPSVDVIKLLLDLSRDLNTSDYVAERWGVRSLNRRSLFVQLIKELLTCNDVGEYGDGSRVVDYPVWRRQRLDELGRSFASRVTTNNYWCPTSTHCIFRLTHNLIQQEEEATCEICDGKIPNTDKAYYCQFCSLSFHQDCCCTSPAITDMSSSALSRVLDSIKKRDVAVFAETHACYSCKRQHKGFSRRCRSCIYRTTLKSGLLSPILRHRYDHDHLLSMNLFDAVMSNYYYCDACGCVIGGNAYNCNICSKEYHMECLHLPPEMKHKHGGHLHSINMEFSCAPKEDEYQWCLFCYKDIDPQKWVYTCKDCDYVAHLYCIFPYLAMRYSPIYGYL